MDGQLRALIHQEPADSRIDLHRAHSACPPLETASNSAPRRSNLWAVLRLRAAMRTGRQCGAFKELRMLLNKRLETRTIVGCQGTIQLMAG